MATYYIDTAGVDTSERTGLTTGQEWASLSYACTRAITSGDIIHINAGTYNESSRCNLSVGVSIEGAGSSNTTVNSTYYLASGSYGAISLYSTTQGTNGNQSISYLKLTGTSLTSYSGISVRYRSNVIIHDCIIQDFIVYGIKMNGGSSYASTSSPGVPPTIYQVGNQIYNCTITNCTGHHTLEGGLIHFDSQQDMLIHDNILTQNSRADGDNGNIIKFWGGHCKGIKYYNNISTKSLNTVTGGWNFHIECGSLMGGCEFYNNQFLGGGVGIDIGAYDNTPGEYGYSAWIHNNLFQLDNQITGSQEWNDTWAITMEAGYSDVIIEKNHIKNYPYAISLIIGGVTTKVANNVIVRYNLMENIGFSDNVWHFANQISSYTTDGESSIENVYWYNNVCTPYYCRGAMYVNATDSNLVNNVYIRNNIFVHVNPYSAYGWLTFWNGDGNISNIYAQNNIVYNFYNSNEEYYYLGKTVSNFVDENNIHLDPEFIGGSPYDYHLSSDSPAINAGMDVGSTTDYEGTYIMPSGPSIGIYEYLQDIFSINKAKIHNWSTI